MRVTPSEASGSTGTIPIFWMAFCAWMFSFLQHIPSFFRTNFIGDEHVYLMLARTMNWDLSNYTTMADPGISGWPNAVYRLPVFFHGPLLPFVMKIGGLVGAPAQAGFLFFNLVVALFYGHYLVLQRRLRVPALWQGVGLLAIAVAPLILFSTTRLHLDALAGLLMACGLIAYMEAFERRSVGWGLWSGILLSLGLNARFSSIGLLPLVAALHYVLVIRHAPAEHRAGGFLRAINPFPACREHWTILLAVAALILTFGLQHYYRLLLVNGTIMPSTMLAATPSPWMDYIAGRTRPRMLTNVVLIVPLIALFCLPATWRAIWDRMRDSPLGVYWAVAFLGCFVLMMIQTYAELRFFAIATPLLYCCLPWVLAGYRRARRPWVLVFTSLALLNMYAVAYRETIIRPNAVYGIVPPLYDYIQYLRPMW